MQRTLFFLVLQLLALGVLAVSLGCRRPISSEEQNAASSPTARAHSARMPVEPDAEDSRLPLEISIREPAVPDKIREPSPPIPPATKR